LSENRSKIDLKVFIIDFESVKNLDDFLSTFAKILIANKYLSSLSLTAPSNMVNFSSTYDKSRRNHELFSNLFQLVEEGNSKTITGGIFGFKERLKLLLNDTNKHSVAFDLFLKTKNIKIEKLYSMEKSQIENLIMLTSSRGVAKSGISMGNKNVGLYRFDNLQPVTIRYDPVCGTVEPWRSRFNSDFLQLSGRIACLRNAEKPSGLQRCAILARAAKQSEATNEDDGVVSWSDCMNLFAQIPSIEISREIIYCSYKSESSIKADSTYKKNSLYHSRFKEVNKDSVINEILSHIQILSLETQEDRIQNENDSQLIEKGVNIILSCLNNLLRTIKEEYAIDEKQFKINIIWSTNFTHFLSGLSKDSIIKSFQNLNKSFKEKNLPTNKYVDHIFEKWMNDNFSNSVKKKKLNKQKIIGISVERSCYEPNKKKLQSFLKADQLEKVKEKIKEKIKEKKV